MSDQEVVLNDSDLEGDELQQDWSLATKLVGSNKTMIPVRGEKDYEPDGTDMQETMLYKARKTMFDVLRQPDRGTLVKNQLNALYDFDSHTANIRNPRGNFINTCGTPNSDGSLTLLFHEFVYLVERGTVTPTVKIDLKDSPVELGLSLQDVYALFKSQTELDLFFVYAYLKRMGYIVFPHKWSYGRQQCIFDDITTTSGQSTPRSFYLNHILHLFSSFSYWYLRAVPFTFKTMLGVLPTKFTSSTEIYQAINNIVPYYIPPKTLDKLLQSRGNASQTFPTTNFKIALDVWKPNPTFKKSSRSLPDFQVVIYNKNDSSLRFPTLHDFKALFSQLDSKFSFMNTMVIGQGDNKSHIGKSTKAPERSKNSLRKKFNASMNSYNEKMKRIKNGYRSFLLAIMDDGLASIIKITETDFGSENVWYTPQPKQLSQKSKLEL